MCVTNDVQRQLSLTEAYAIMVHYRSEKQPCEQRLQHWELTGSAFVGKVNKKTLFALSTTTRKTS